MNECIRVQPLANLLSAAVKLGSRKGCEGAYLLNPAASPLNKSWSPGYGPRIGVLPEGGIAVKVDVVSAPPATKVRLVPPARGQGTDFASPPSDPQWVR